MRMLMRSLVSSMTPRAQLLFLISAHVVVLK